MHPKALQCCWLIFYKVDMFVSLIDMMTNLMRYAGFAKIFSETSCTFLNHFIVNLSVIWHWVIYLSVLYCLLASIVKVCKRNVLLMFTYSAKNNILYPFYNARLILKVYRTMLFYITQFCGEKFWKKWGFYCMEH